MLFRCFEQFEKINGDETERCTLLTIYLVKTIPCLNILNF